jgi:hypothetical protein
MRLELELKAVGGHRDAFTHGSTLRARSPETSLPDRGVTIDDHASIVNRPGVRTADVDVTTRV